jgi:hypothetical protein
VIALFVPLLHVTAAPKLLMQPLSLERPRRCGSLNHVVDVVNMIGRRPLIDDHTDTLKVQVPVKQPSDTDEKWGLAIPQHQEQCSQSPREVASTLTNATRLRRHGVPTRQCANMLPCCQLPCHLEKRRNESK